MTGLCHRGHEAVKDEEVIEMYRDTHLSLDLLETDHKVSVSLHIVCMCVCVCVCVGMYHMHMYIASMLSVNIIHEAVVDASSW